ncbi:ABC transporter permease [Rhizorhabdus dicambivorans]|uniref:ABC transporter permease n=1 Tax=Rhizorhabdus dicambivorans TaxID=1850238 RepID=A0A2A4FP23_9SPHN|nr:ABC transporter permease [Rhizorhabdus dicambivorans]ATE65143.1 ABC transporter permease [Rhizorhabdus dicambivorans]PCE39907.1 ABC transporter permease [Rhizorhabdus dicambivorans]
MNSSRLHRLVAIIVKELWAVLRDPKSRATLFAPPIIQLFLFGFAVTLEVRNFNVGVLDRDQGVWSHEVVSRIAGSPNVGRVIRLQSPADLRNAIDNQRIIAAVAFEQRFSADVEAGRVGTAQVILDGRRSNASQIVAGYLQQIVASAAAEAGAMGAGQSPMTRTAVTNWFNPNLHYRWFVMPGLIVIIGALMALAVTAQSLARERELGSFDQLMVSPLRVHEILIGKMTSPLIVGLVNATIYVVLIPTMFRVPLTGSLVSFYLSLTVYLLSLIGVGMLISSLAQTQQQAFLGSFLVGVPAILLSGFATPIDNMPDWLQLVTLINPPRHFLIVAEGVFLKNMPASEVLANSWPMALIALVTLSAAAFLFRARME